MFARLWDGIEVGAALSVYWRGECVVDLWGGHRDKDRNQPWQQQTLVNTYSITKGVVAFAIARLVADGHLGYQHKVSKYWPEFSQNGKSDITVAQLLSHQAGLCGLGTRLEVTDLYDWQKITHLLAAQSPLWIPGSAAGYHAVTWGFLAGELIRRVTGELPGQYIDRALAEPMDLNFYLGVPDERLDQCAELIGPNHIPADKLPAPQKKPGNDQVAPSPLFELAQLNPIISPYKHASSTAWRRAQIPASNGHSDARSLAKLYGIAAMNPSSLESALKVAVTTEDLVMGHVIKRSEGGFILAYDGNYGPFGQGFGHAGAGGSMAFGDPSRKLGFAYVMNQLQPEGYKPRYGEILDEISHIID